MASEAGGFHEEKGVEGVGAASVEVTTDAPPQGPSGIITAAVLDARCKHMLDNVDQLPAQSGFADLRQSPWCHLVTQLRPQLGKEVRTGIDAGPWEGTNAAEKALREGVAGLDAHAEHACAHILSRFNELKRQAPGTSLPLLVLELDRGKSRRLSPDC